MAKRGGADEVLAPHGRARSCASLAACARRPEFQAARRRRPRPAMAAPYAEQTTAAAASASARRRRAALRRRHGHSESMVDAVPLSRSSTAWSSRRCKANPNVGAAQAALRQAHELYLAQRTSFFPSVQGSFSGDRSEFPTNTLTSPTVASSSTYTLYTAQLTLSYAPDIFGATRRASRDRQGAGRQQPLSTRGHLPDLEQQCRGHRDSGGIAARTDRGHRAVAAAGTPADRHRAAAAALLGTASDLDVLAQQSLEAQTAQTLPPLQKQLGQTRDALTALLGQAARRRNLQQTFRLDELTLPDRSAGEPALKTRSNSGRMCVRRKRICTWPRLRSASRLARSAAAIRDQRRLGLERADFEQAVYALHAVSGTPAHR